MVGGVYKITNTRNGKFYIGSTRNFKNRKSDHFRDLRNNKNGCLLLQRAYNKEEDKSVFIFSPYIVTRDADRLLFEQRCLDVLKPAYNANPNATRPPVFLDLPEDVQEKLSKKKSEQQKKAGHRPPRFSELSLEKQEEVRATMSVSQTLRYSGEEGERRKKEMSENHKILGIKPVPIKNLPKDKQEKAYALIGQATSRRNTERWNGEGCEGRLQQQSDALSAHWATDEGEKHRQNLVQSKTTYWEFEDKTVPTKVRKLTTKKVEEILELGEKYTYEQIAKMFLVNPTTVRDVLLGRSHKHVARKYPPKTVRAYSKKSDNPKEKKPKKRSIDSVLRSSMALIMSHSNYWGA